MVSNGRERWWGGAAADDTPHSVLGIARNATPDEVQKAYRRQMKACHPDLSDGGSRAADEARARQLNAAMEELRGTEVAASATHRATSYYRPGHPDRPVSSSERYTMFCERQPGRVMSARNNLRLRAFIMLTLMSIATYKRVFPDPDSPYYTPRQKAPSPQKREPTAAATVATPASRTAAIALCVAEAMQQESSPAAVARAQESSVASERWDRL